MAQSPPVVSFAGSRSTNVMDWSPLDTSSFLSARVQRSLPSPNAESAKADTTVALSFPPDPAQSSAAVRAESRRLRTDAGQRRRRSTRRHQAGNSQDGTADNPSDPISRFINFHLTSPDFTREDRNVAAKWHLCRIVDKRRRDLGVLAQPRRAGPQGNKTTLKRNLVRSAHCFELGNIGANRCSYHVPHCKYRS